MVSKKYKFGWTFSLDNLNYAGILLTVQQYRLIPILIQWILIFSPTTLMSSTLAIMTTFTEWIKDLQECNQDQVQEWIKDLPYS